MATLTHLVVMWIAGWVAIVVAAFRRLLLGPTRPSWSWRTELTIASLRAVLAAAVRYREDERLFRAGLRITTPVPLALWRRVDLRRVHVGEVVADRYIPTTVFQAPRIILYFHGGGYAFGNPGTHRQFIARLVDATQAGAVAPRYRLAPLYRFPSAVDDAERAYRGLLDAGIEAERIVVAGDSAGGGLATALLVRVRATGLPMPAGAMLFSPYLDLEHTGYTIQTNAATDYLPLSELTGPNTWYAHREQLRNPEVSPIHADLTGFPPMLVFAGGAEMLLADSLRLADHAARDGVSCTLEVEPDMVHVWPAIVDHQPATRRTLDAARAWLDDLADASGAPHYDP